MFQTQIWENEKYKISVGADKSTLIDKVTGDILADTINLATKESTMAHLKQLIIFKELGNPTESILWENELYLLKLGWMGKSVELKEKSEDETLVEFKLNSPKVVDVIHKVVAFL